VIEDQPLGSPGGNQVVIRCNDVEGSRRLLEQNAETLAAVLIDPLSSRVGMVPPGPALLAMLRAFRD
jgi:glutamate-1-semialdehyde 2,1-aminomutase